MKVRTLPVIVLATGLALSITLLVVAKEPAPNTLLADRDASHAVSMGVDKPSTENNATQVNGTVNSTSNWQSGGPVGAAVNAIAFDPVVSRRVYAATAGGGLYRSTDGGDTWDDAPNDPDDGLSLGKGHGWVYDLAATEGVIYAATSGYEWFHWSTDEGETWSHASGEPGWAGDLAVHPAVSTTLYAASAGGVYTSANGGRDWRSASAGMAPNEWITEIAFHPVTPTTVYASSGNGRVYRSVDGGAHWVSSSTGLSGQIVWSVAVNPVTPTILYAGLEADGVWRSEDGGDTWSPWSGGDIHCPYVREIVVDPADPKAVYVGTDGMGVYKRAEGEVSWAHLGPFYTQGQRRVYAIGMSREAPGSVLAGVWGDGIYKSTNSGEDWQACTVNLSALRISQMEADPAHPGSVYATGRGGLFKSADAGKTWERIRETHGSSPLYSDAFALEIAETTGTVYVGMYGGTLITATDGVHWHAAHTGLPSSCTVWDVAVNPITPTIVYAGLRWGPAEQMGVYKSTDGGAHWIRASSGLTDTDVIVVAVDPTDPQLVYAGSPRGNVFRSSDGGGNWTWSGSGVVVKNERATIWDIVPDPEAPGIVYLAQSNEGVSEQGGIYKSTDYGMTWDRVLKGHDPRALVIDPVDHDVLIAASWNDYLHRSEDGGDTWSIYDADAFPGYRYVRALTIGRTDGGWRLYAGTGTNSVWQRDIHAGFHTYLPLVAKRHDPAVDDDHDGLTDEEERMKYKTSPDLADTDGDGTPDGDWDERREYAYTVRILMKIRQPFDVDAMNDWYQDVRVLDGPDQDGYTRIEAIIYPDTLVDYSPSSFPVSDLPDGFQTYTEPGIATNYSPSMQSEVLQILEDADTDEEAVNQVLQWVSDETTFYLDYSIPEVYYTYVEDGEVKVRNYGGSLPVEELLQTHYFAESMFEMRTHGTCTSIATLKCAMLKAAGIPCRVLQTIFPIYYHGDQTVPYENNLTREWHCNFEQGSGEGPWWCNHAFLEVYLGGRWVRADWTINVRHEDPLCLSLKIISVSDWSEVDFSQTWPVDWVHERPYYTLLLEDQEPQH